MRGFKPDPVLWSKINQAILDENAATVMVTMVSGLCAIITSSGVCADEDHARAHLAAMLISPDNREGVGSLREMMEGELETLNDGKWIV